MFWNSITRARVPFCRECGLHTQLDAMGIPSRETIIVGEGQRRILILTEPKGLNDRNYPYSEYLPLFEELQARVPNNIRLLSDCWLVPALRCAPFHRNKDKAIVPVKDTFNRTKCCRPYIEQVIEDLKPSVIICIGKHALEILYGERGVNGIGCFTLMGFFVPDHALGAWVTVLPDLADVIADNSRKRENDGILDTAWNNALEDAIHRAAMPLPAKVDYDKQVVILTEYDDVLHQLQHVLATKPEWFDFDYETNCVKAHHPEAQLYSVSWMTDDDFAYSVPFGGWKHFTPTQLAALYDAFRAIMQDPDIKKSCHNLPMEDSWTNVHIGTEVENWGWDSLVAQHMLNVTRGTKSLKFQVFARYGYGPYEGAVSQWLHSPDGERLNRIHASPMRTVLHYGGLDAVFTRKLRQDQMRQMQAGRKVDNKLRDCFQHLYLPGTVTMSHMSMNGLRMDAEYYQTLDEKLECEQKELVETIRADEAVQRFEKDHRLIFNVGSGDDVRTLFFTHLGFTANTFTDTGQESVTAEVLEELEIPVAQNIVKWRKLDKIRGTYIAQYLFEIDDGIIHPAFNLGRARSGRSSCIVEGGEVTVVQNGKPRSVPIEKVEEGNTVVTVADDLQQTTRRVLWAGKTGHKRCVRVHFVNDDGSPAGAVECTPDHRLRQTDGAWVEAQHAVGAHIIPMEYK